MEATQNIIRTENADGSEKDFTTTPRAAFDGEANTSSFGNSYLRLDGACYFIPDGGCVIVGCCSLPEDCFDFMSSQGVR